jgi:hypothetical protein
VQTSYAVKWSEPDGQTFVGQLELSPTALVLEGRDGTGCAVRREIGFDQLLSFRVGQRADERLDGQPTLVVERLDGQFLVTSTVMHTGLVQEVVHRLSELTDLAPRRATVVIPLKEGASEQAWELAAQGPPFDPAETLLTRHQLLLTASEVIFVFEAESGPAFERFLSELDLWAAAADWRDLVAGTPRLAELVYAWERPVQLSGVGLGL